MISRQTQHELSRLIGLTLKTCAEYYLAEQTPPEPLSQHLKREYDSFDPKDPKAKRLFNLIIQTLWHTEPGLKSPYFSMVFLINQHAQLAKENHNPEAKLALGYGTNQEISALRRALIDGETISFHSGHQSVEYTPRTINLLSEADEYPTATSHLDTGGLRRYSLPSESTLSPGVYGKRPRVSTPLSDEHEIPAVFTKVVQDHNAAKKEAAFNRLAYGFGHAIKLSGEREDKPYVLIAAQGFPHSQTLASKLDDEQWKPEQAEVIKLARDLLQEYNTRCAEKGIIHLDLHDKNILIDPLGLPRISDFGEAQMLNNPQDLEKLALVAIRNGTHELRFDCLNKQELQQETREITIIEPTPGKTGHLPLWALLTRAEALSTEPQSTITPAGRDDHYALTNLIVKLLKKAGVDLLATENNAAEYFLQPSLERIHELLNRLEKKPPSTRVLLSDLYRAAMKQQARQAESNAPGPLPQHTVDPLILNAVSNPHPPEVADQNAQAPITQQPSAKPTALEDISFDGITFDEESHHSPR